MRKKEVCSNERKCYEQMVGRVSDSAWWRFKKRFEKYGFALTEENIQAYLQKKQTIKRTSLSDVELIAAFGLAEEHLKRLRSSYSGEQLMNEVERIYKRPHSTTITKWFADIGGYSKTKTYDRDQIKHILIKCYTYKKIQEKRGK